MLRPWVKETSSSSLDTEKGDEEMSGNSKGKMEIYVKEYLPSIEAFALEQVVILEHVP